MSSSPHSIVDRVAALDWPTLLQELSDFGVVRVGPLLTVHEAETLAALYDEPENFRTRIHMARHGFGKGEYQYFSYPLPSIVAELRTLMYARLYGLANAWSAELKSDQTFPDSHAAFLGQCADAGQSRPTPLLLRYIEGDFNCLHQDLYGDLAFPFQMVTLLSQPGRDFTGGEFTLVEQRPRMQSRAEVVALSQGDAAIFAVHHRPAKGARGSYRVNLKHGVSRVRSGRRHTMGIIFHDAR
jgi:uncharacterized protein